VAGALRTRRHDGIIHHGEWPVAANAGQIFNAYGDCDRAVGPSDRKTFALDESDGMRHRATFAQILGKLYFFQLLENLRRILLDYGQKLSDPANAAFNAAC